MKDMQTFAIVIGVSRFQNDLPSLEYIEDDVNEICRVFIEKLEVAHDCVTRLTDYQATCKNIQDAVESIASIAKSGDRILLYFATHGRSAYSSPWLAAFDSKSADPSYSNNWINTSEIIGKLNNAGCNVLCFLDCCQSTMFLVTRGENEATALSFSGETQYCIAFAAAGVNEVAHPDPEFAHGCWTYYLINALSGSASQAFEGYSHRITANSLQQYLAEMVPHRVNSLYGERQTPYIWGTRAEDIVIAEYKNVERDNMKIGDIFFGEIDTDTEKAKAPSPDFLTQNYYDLNSIYRKLQSENSIYAIIGNKGTGKTFIGEYLCAQNRNMIYQSVGGISFSDIRNITMTQTSEKGKYTNSWKYALYSILAFHIVNEKMEGFDELDTVLSCIYGPQKTVIQNNPIQRRSLLLNKRVKNSIRLSPEYGAYCGENGIASIELLVCLFEDIFNKYYSDNTNYFFIDGLDNQIRGVLQPDQKALFLDLIDMVQATNELLTGIRFVLFLRHDILRLLNEEANLNKSVTSHSEILGWVLASATRKEMTPLYQLIDKRIMTSSLANSGIEKHIWDILPAKMKYQDTWDWIMELTTYTPRDLIAFFNECKVVAPEQSRLSQDNLWNATREYSNYLWRELTDVINGTCLSGCGDELLSMFTKIAQTHNVNTSSTNTKFSFSDFSDAYMSYEKLKTIPLSDALKVLYESGVMGVHDRSGKTYWYFREDPIAFELDHWRDATFDVHKGLWKKMHIW